MAKCGRCGQTYYTSGSAARGMCRNCCEEEDRMGESAGDPGHRISPVFNMGLILFFAVSLLAILAADYFGTTDDSVEFYPSFLDHDELSIYRTGYSTVIQFNSKVSAMKVSCTGSMHPMIGCNNTLIVQKIDNSTELGIGDIVAYKDQDDGDHYILHQIVEKKNGCFILKGINNPDVDKDCIKQEDMTHRVIMIIPTKEFWGMVR